MQATVVVPTSPTAPIPTGRHVLTGGMYRPGERPVPATITCVFCGKPITANQRRAKIGMGILHDEPAVPCAADFDAYAYGPRRVR